MPARAPLVILDASVPSSLPSIHHHYSNDKISLNRASLAIPLASAQVHVLDTHLQAHQIEESSAFSCFKMFHQPRKCDLLFYSQIIVECLLCVRPHAMGTTASF